MAKPDQTSRPKFPGRYTYTVGDPNSLGDIPAGTGVAIKVGGTDGATPEQIKAWIAAHPGTPALVWAAPVEGEDAVTTYRNAAAVAQQVGASGFIAQGESVEQMNAAAAVTGDVHIPKAIVTNGAYVAKWPAGWGVDFEYYPNQPGSGMNPQNMAAFLKSVVSQGATFAQVTGGSWNQDTVPMAQYQAAIDYLRSQGINVNGFSIYIWNSMTPEQKEGFLHTLGVPAGAAPTTAAPVHAQAPPKKAKKAKPATASAESHASHKENPLGIQGPHQKAGTDGAPAPHTGKGYAPVVDDPKNPNDTFSFTDKKGRRVTITTTASGAKMEQVEGHSAYQIKKADEQPNDPTKPAWHQNDAWGAGSADTAAKAHVDANTVLEQRPGANGNTILRMADGTYKNLHADGTVTGAGTWNKDQWDETNHGQDAVPGSGITTGGAATPPPAEDTNPFSGLSGSDRSGVFNGNNVHPGPQL